ncbi:hypothetical protein SKTS_09080 [Sulfurimicrobium lacus]|uniref:Uncharacterized protein n=1 Tax=Sulfurimicrobium lacus TaxID=2715678 RepID=A0A6F8VAM8_9PROT|nr:hypothetical protein [Sulfurimicrobium lacus]BCB26022.1 hypothetical protein SKTS_09080 [Sulfurimicrobium lacus]
MNQDQTLSDEFLNAFVDDQLDPAEKSRTFELIEQDEALKARVCELRGLKEKVQLAYLQPPPPVHATKKSWLSGTPYRQALAASLSGWFAHNWTGYTSDRDIMRLLQTVQRNDLGADPHKLMIHVGNANPVRLSTALDEAENLLASSKRANRPMRVEIIANGGGLELLRAGSSPYAQRIAAMREKYPNLELTACGQTLRNLRAKGVDVRLLPDTGIAPSAVDEITLRLKQGWGYIKV